MSALPMSAVGTARLHRADALRAVALLPRNALIALFTAYRATISKTYGDVCRYYPSCSAYGGAAVQQHGALKGAALTVARICRCNPWAAGGEDDVKPHKNFKHELTRRGFVVPHPSERTHS